VSEEHFFELIPRNKIPDSRGYFLKIMHGSETMADKQFGEIYLVKGEAGKSRANHFHEVATEWFTVIQGKVSLILEELCSGEQVSIYMDADMPVTVKVPPKVAHSLVGIDGADYMLLAYSDKPYVPSDTIPYNISTHMPREVKYETS
jgi:dTDP-4-dehydrorhamnose 3,5-epimerase-like enzyme